jgi:hypothetical protein
MTLVDCEVFCNCGGGAARVGSPISAKILEGQSDNIYKRTFISR